MTSHDLILLHRIREVINDVEPTAQVILYGSRARGDAQPDSDWDLLVLRDGPVDYHRAAAVRHRLYPLELEADIVVSAMVLSEEEWHSPLAQAMPFQANVMRESVEV